MGGEPYFLKAIKDVKDWLCERWCKDEDFGCVAETNEGRQEGR